MDLVRNFKKKFNNNATYWRINQRVDLCGQIAHIVQKIIKQIR